MLGRKREDLASKGGAKKRKKWQEESDDDEEPEEATVTAEEIQEWKAKMAEEEKQEERERQRREREQREEAERQERERQKRIEEEERERKELEEQLEEEERERQNARRERAEKVAQEVKRLWDQPPVETSPSPVRTVPPRVVPVPVPPVAVGTPPVPVMTPLMQAQAAGANIAASLMASHPASGGEEGDVTVHVQVPASRVKDLLGVQGRNIKAIKSQTGVMKVGVLDRNDPANVEIVGSAAAVEQCRALVQSVVDGDLTAIGNISETMDIDSRLISRLIGPKGQNISNMKDQSGAYLAVKEVSPGVNKVVITGFPDCVARGRELVVNFMNQDHSLMPTGMPGQGLPPQMPNGMRPCGFGHQGEDGMPARMPVQGMPQNAWGPGPGKGFAKGANQSPGWSNEWEGQSWQGDWQAPAWPDQAWGKGKNNWNPSMGNHGDFGKGGAFQPETWEWGNERQEANWAPMAPMGSAIAPIGAPIGSAIGSSMGPSMAPAIGSPDTTSWDDQQGPGWSQEWDPAWQQRWPQPAGFGGFSGAQNGAIGAGQAWNA